MDNFLTIPVQEEIVRKYNESIILRGARASGKTLTAIRWAIENMKARKNIIYLMGCNHYTTGLMDMFIDELRRQGLTIMNATREAISIPYGSVHFFSTASSIFQHQTFFVGKPVVLDDADYFAEDIFMQTHFYPERFIITGYKEGGIFKRFLAPDWSNNYYEINYLNMRESGLMTNHQFESLKHLFPSNEIKFKELFGPWIQASNKYYKSLLARYDS